MLASNLIGAVSTAVLFALLYFHFISFISLILLMLIIGIVTLGFDISRTGYTVALVPKNRIPHANSLIEGANAVGEGIGPSIGGWIFQVAGAAFSLLFDFVSYIVSSLLVFINIWSKKESGLYEQIIEEEQTDTSSDSDYRNGFSYVFSHGVIRSIALSAGQFNFFTSAFFAVYYVFTIHNLHINATEVGLAATFSGIAGIVSAAATGKIIFHLPSEPLYIYSLALPSIAAMFVSLSSLFTAQHFIVLISVCFSQFLWSFAVNVSIILGESIKQVITPENILGQVSSAERMIALIAEPIRAIAGGFCATIIGETHTLYITVLGLGSSILWTLGKTGILSFKKPKEW